MCANVVGCILQVRGEGAGPVDLMLRQAAPGAGRSQPGGAPCFLACRQMTSGAGPASRLPLPQTGNCFSDAPDQRGPFPSWLCCRHGRLGCVSWIVRAGRRTGNSGPAITAYSVHELPAVRRNIRHPAGRPSAARRGNSDQVRGPGNEAAPDGAQLIDCGGRVIMPGLIDAHWHALFAAVALPQLLGGTIGSIYLAAAAEAERTLMRGFTTVRDLGGPVFALQASNRRRPRLRPAHLPVGAMITTTGGHGDMRPLSDLPRSPGGPLSAMERTGAA